VKHAPWSRPARVAVLFPAAIAATSLALSTNAGAQQGDTVALTKVVQFSIPSAPAFELIGEAPDKITRPTSARALAAGLLSGITAAGKLQQGVALEVAPGQLLRPHMDLDEFQTTTGFLLANVSLSLGSVRASGDTSDTDVGFGIKSVLLDHTDPDGPASRDAGRSAIMGAMLDCLPVDANGTPVAIDRANAAQIKAIKACVSRGDSTFRTSWQRTHWNDYALSLSASNAVRLRGSRFDRTSELAAGVWALAAAPLCFRSVSDGLCQHGQWLAKVGYEHHDSLGASSRPNGVTGGVRATLGTAKVSVFGEDLFERVRAVSGSATSRNAWSAGLEFLAGEGMWISTGIGSRYDDLTRSSRAVVLAGLRFNVSQKQTFGSVVPVPRFGPQVPMPR